MVSIWYKCRKCRAYLFTNEHLASAKDSGRSLPATELGNENFTPHRTVDTSTLNSGAANCSIETLYFLKLEDCPAWILKLLEKVSDKVRMYEEIMTNDDNLESNLLTSSLLKMCSLVQVELCLLPGGRR